MSMVTTGPRIYLAVTDEDLGQVLYWLNAIKDCALENASKDVSKRGCPIPTTFRFLLPPCMTVEIESTKEG